MFCLHIRYSSGSLQLQEAFIMSLARGGKRQYSENKNGSETWGAFQYCTTGLNTAEMSRLLLAVCTSIWSSSCRRCISSSAVCMYHLSSVSILALKSTYRSFFCLGKSKFTSRDSVQQQAVVGVGCGGYHTTPVVSECEMCYRELITLWGWRVSANWTEKKVVRNIIWIRVRWWESCVKDVTRRVLHTVSSQSCQNITTKCNMTNCCCVLENACHSTTQTTLTGFVVQSDYGTKYESDSDWFHRYNHPSTGPGSQFYVLKSDSHYFQNCADIDIMHYWHWHYSSLQNNVCLYVCVCPKLGNAIFLPTKTDCINLFLLIKMSWNFN